MNLFGYVLIFLGIVSVAVTASNDTNTDSWRAFRADIEESETSSAARLRRYLRNEMWRRNIPALSALVFRRNQVIFEYTAGKANIKDKIKLKRNHPFLLASISKVVTATALLQLYEDRKFKLNEPINRYLDFKVKHPRFGKDITFQMLLTHTASIADANGPMSEQYYDDRDSPIALEDFLRDYFTPGRKYYNKWKNFVNKRPGTKYSYSNIGTALVGLLVEKISGENFADYCVENIFKPLEMDNTAWRLANLPQTKVTPYDMFKGKFTPYAHYTFTDYPNGGLRSTAMDMFKFLRAFVNNGRAGNVQLLKKTTVRAMLRRQVRGQNKNMGLQL